eukprot:CAMPEP_0178956442 /NCGR_PEP_ID=MMETSP0789-20121207/10253_1 /TAXON_ID=3005 /ORGANISM="Rhizosolenia setigera, Strain CCMP 1694" /LENGTH=239 /DNA_ID=CAMNT_0020638365 /DNA_START=126 /DNA_END=845 /DNA_ORIENTATION=+
MSSNTTTKYYPQPSNSGLEKGKKSAKADEKDKRVLSSSDLNVSAGGKFYERAKSRRERTRRILSDISEDAKPLGSRRGSRGPNGTSDIFMPRHGIGRESDEWNEEFEKKGEMRFIKIRSMNNQRMKAGNIAGQKTQRRNTLPKISKKNSRNSFLQERKRRSATMSSIGMKKLPTKANRSKVTSSKKFSNQKASKPQRKEVSSTSKSTQPQNYPVRGNSPPKFIDLSVSSVSNVIDLTCD